MSWWPLGAPRCGCRGRQAMMAAASGCWCRRQGCCRRRSAGRDRRQCRWRCHLHLLKDMILSLTAHMHSVHTDSRGVCTRGNTTLVHPAPQSALEHICIGSFGQRYKAASTVAQYAE